MPTKRTSTASRHSEEHVSLPLDAATWMTIAEALALSPQQIRIVEHILQGKQDKEIASDLGLAVPTVRTYLNRIFQRVDVNDRLTLVLRIFEMAQRQTTQHHCR